MSNKRESRKPDPYFRPDLWPTFLRKAREESTSREARRRLQYNDTLDAADMIPQGKGEFYEYGTRVVWETIFRKSIQIGRMNHADVPRVEDKTKSAIWNAVSDFNQYLAVIRSANISRDILDQGNILKLQALAELTWYQFITTPESLDDTPKWVIHEYWAKRVGVFIGSEDFYARISNRHKSNW